MGSVRYIGSKTRLAWRILGLLGQPHSEQQRFVDLFSGTGVVSKTAAEFGWRVFANDQLGASACLTEAQLLAASDVRFGGVGGYSEVARYLSSLPGQEGFIFREYSPSGNSKAGVDRQYFTCENAARIDAIRAEIRRLRQEALLQPREETLLLADLIQAANRVANISGTYGCFLNRFSTTTLKPIEIRCRELHPVPVDYEVSCADAFAAKLRPEDLVYIDPPYTKRQYAAYYHIPETIFFGDEPEVEGITGLRPWKEKSSDFCYKRRALKAFSRLLDGMNASRIAISYSSDGHVALEDLLGIAESHGTVSVQRFENFGRYQPNQQARDNADSVTEYLVVIERCEEPATIAEQ